MNAARISWSQASFHVTTGIYFKRRKPPPPLQQKDLSGEQAIPGHVCCIMQPVVTHRWTLHNCIRAEAATLLRGLDRARRSFIISPSPRLAHPQRHTCAEWSIEKDNRRGRGFIKRSANSLTACSFDVISREEGRSLPAAGPRFRLN